METESTRQQKVGRLIQKEIGDILLKEGAELVKGVMVTVTAVRVSPDLSYAKAYFSIFPFNKNQEVMTALNSANKQIRGILGRRVKTQLRIVPSLAFFLDDSMEYLENIESLLKK